MNENIEYILEDNLAYELVDSFAINNKKYLFLVGKINHDPALVYEEDNIIKNIEDDNEYNKVFDLLYERNIERIEELLKN